MAKPSLRVASLWTAITVGCLALAAGSINATVSRVMLSVSMSSRQPIPDIPQPQAQAALAVRLLSIDLTTLKLGADEDALARADRIARRVLAAEPLSVKALFVLAAVAAARSDQPATSNALAAVWRRSKRETLPTVMQAGLALENANPTQFADSVEALFLRRPEYVNQFTELLLPGFERSALLRQEYWKRLAGAPEWASRMTETLAAQGSDAVVQEYLGQAEPSPFVTRAREIYVGRLLEDGKIAEAEVQAGPLLANRAQVRSLRFPSADGRTLFDWLTRDVDGADVSFTTTPAPVDPAVFGSGIYASVSGLSQPADLIQRAVAVQPGRYELDVLLRPENSGEFTFTVSCWRGEVLARLDARPGNASKDTIGFDVSSNCPALRLALAVNQRSNSAPTSVEAWVGNLRRLGTAAIATTSIPITAPQNKRPDQPNEPKQ